MKVVLGLLLTLLFAATAVAAGPQHATVSAKADRANVKPGESFTVEVTVVVDDGFHVQSHTPSEKYYTTLAVAMTPNASVDFGAPAYPNGVNETYPLLGKLNVYTGTIVVRVPVTVKPGVGDGALAVGGKVTYQACNASACFQPQSPAFQASVTIDAPTSAGPPRATSPAATTAPTEASGPRTGPVGEIVKQALAFLVLATAFYFARPLLPHVVTPPAFWWTLFAIIAAGGIFLVVRLW